MAIIYSLHAKEMLELRHIDQKLASRCVKNPDHILPTPSGKKIYLKDCGVNFLKLVAAEEGDDIVIVTGHWLAKKRVKQ